MVFGRSIKKAKPKAINLVGDKLSGLLFNHTLLKIVKVHLKLINNGIINDDTGQYLQISNSKTEKK